jgi:hypothetical protein
MFVLLGLFVVNVIWLIFLRQCKSTFYRMFYIFIEQIKIFIAYAFLIYIFYEIHKETKFLKKRNNKHVDIYLLVRSQTIF